MRIKGGRRVALRSEEKDPPANLNAFIGRGYGETGRRERYGGSREIGGKGDAKKDGGENEVRRGERDGGVDRNRNAS